jgi:hypothetical protein
VANIIAFLTLQDILVGKAVSQLKSVKIAGGNIPVIILRVFVPVSVTGR